MALQASNLILVGLGTWKDVPPNAEQPPLVDGIHLRWAFKRELGFPWYGFYLFRRVHRAGTPVWLSQVIGQLPKGTWTDRKLDTPQGQVSSDVNLALTDDFPPTGAVEFDLAGRRYLRFTLPAQGLARRVEARIGFRPRPGDPPPTCVSFMGRPLGEGPNPLNEQNVSFEARDRNDQLRPHTSVRAVQNGPDRVTGLDCKFRLYVTLPRPAAFVEVTLTNSERADQTDRTPTIEAFNQDGTSAGTATMQAPLSRRPQTLLMSGTAITRIVIDDHHEAGAADNDEDRTILNEICYGRATVSEVQLSGFSGDTPVGKVSIRGYTGRVVSSAIEFEGISAVELSPAPAALVDLGTVPLSQDATVGWEQIPDFPYPMRLPVTQPDYPCTRDQSEDFTRARKLAQDRIRYGDARQFTSPSAPLPSAGTILVTNGSPIVTGAGTSWSNDLLDTILQVTGDPTVYTVVMVVAPNKLVLSRSYVGASRSGAQYTIARDSFGQLYNYLVSLVAGGSAAGPMASRALPAPVATTGQVAVTQDSPTVQGIGTAWTADLTGLAFQVADERTVYTIVRVDSPTRLTVDRNYQGMTGQGKAYRISARLQASGAGVTVPRMPAQLPLDMVLLGTLHPAVAEMVGLHWTDRPSDRTQTYDYLVVADSTGVAGLDAAKMLSVIQQTGFSSVDGSIAYNLQMASATPLARPEGLRAYALPGTSRRTESGATQEAVNNVGLRWDLNKTDLGVLLPGRPVLYHVWRANLDNGATPTTSNGYNLISKDRPVLVAETGVTPQRARDWPPFSMHAIDNALADGWYSYQVSGIDIFGRHTPNSAASPWYEWAPPPEPRPWYYKDPPGDTVVHPSAVRLLVKIPPPAPPGIEASALDPADPTVVKDAAYTAWWNALAASAWYQALSQDQKRNLIGLRVRWLWTTAQMEQAPHIDEFRIYYQPGPLNALLGRTRAVASASTLESDVTTDIPNTQPAGSYVGASLHVGDDAFVIVASQAGTPLRIRVQNIGPLDNIAPRVNAPCTVAIPPVYAAGAATVTKGSRTVTGVGTAWGATLAGMVFQIATEQTAYIVATVDSPTRLTLDRDYGGPANVDAVYSIRHPRFVDCGMPTSWQTRYYVVNASQNWTQATDPAGRPLRRYEIFLPVPQDSVHDGVPLTPSLIEPIVYAHIGVSAADDKPYTADDPKWTGRWGGRVGNEGRVGPPAKIFRVRREQPPLPVSPPMPERVFATRADANGHSFYTYRWRPADGVKTHVFRALDDAVFKVDWSQRPRPPLDASKVEFFPDATTDPRWNAAKRQQVATELNRLNTFSKDAAGTVQAMAYYRALSPDALRVLTGLPGNDAAFNQLTTQPLDPDDPANANRRGPDDPDSFQVGDPSNPLASPTLRAFLDTLDGRAINRYFYRAAYVDAAHNGSALALASPPVSLPKVVAPAPPLVQLALAAEGKVRLQWMASPESDVIRYRVYRAADEQAATDVRSMQPVATVAPAPTAPPASGVERPVAVPSRVGALEYAVPTPPGEWFFRIVAEDDAANRSAPSGLLHGRSIQPPPSPPVWNPPVRTATSVLLSWTHPTDPHLASFIERRAPGQQRWVWISGWLAPGVYTFTDVPPQLGGAWEYRLRVRDEHGQTAGTMPMAFLDAMR
jgi:hypothetical protein